MGNWECAASVRYRSNVYCTGEITRDGIHMYALQWSSSQSYICGCDVPSKHLRWHSNERMLWLIGNVLSFKRASQKHFVRWIFLSVSPSLPRSLRVPRFCSALICIFCSNISVYLYLTHNTHRHRIKMMPNIRLYYEFNVLKMWMIILEYARVRMLFSRLTVYSCHKCGTYAYALAYINRHTYIHARTHSQTYIDEAKENIYGELDA